MSTVPNPVLKRDPALGFYTQIDESRIDDFREMVEDYELEVSTEKKGGDRLETPEMVTFFFRSKDKELLSDFVEFCGIRFRAAAKRATTYQCRAGALLEAGEPGSESREKVAALKLDQQDIPDLIQIATDPDLNGARTGDAFSWGPIHAWRELGRLQAEEAIEPLMELFQASADSYDDWLLTDIPMAIGMIGPKGLAALASLSKAVYDSEDELGYGNECAVTGFAQVGLACPELRGQCVQHLRDLLNEAEKNTRDVNGYVVSALIDLGAKEAIPDIRKAYAANRVEDMIAGDIDEVEEAMEEPDDVPTGPEYLSWLDARRLADESDEDFDGSDEDYFADKENEPAKPFIAEAKPGRNDLCPCGSGKKYKKCCGQAG